MCFMFCNVMVAALLSALNITFILTSLSHLYASVVHLYIPELFSHCLPTTVCVINDCCEDMTLNIYVPLRCFQLLCFWFIKT